MRGAGTAATLPASINEGGSMSEHDHAEDRQEEGEAFRSGVHV